MNKKRDRIKADAVQHWVPADRDEVNAAIDEIGTLQRERLRIEAAMNDEMAEVKARHDAKAKPAGDRLAELAKGVQLYCEANRTQLTQDGKVKFHSFATGEVKWRLTPFAVSISKAGEVLALLKAKGMQQYVRTKEEVDKEALLADRTAVGDSIKGVKFGQKEEFSVIPNESQIEQVQS